MRLALLAGFVVACAWALLAPVPGAGHTVEECSLQYCNSGPNIWSGHEHRDIANLMQDDDEGWARDGDDTLVGGLGSDILHAGPGDDLVVGSSGKDTLFGGLGNDRLDSAAGDGVDTSVCGNGFDVLEMDPDDWYGLDCEVIWVVDKSGEKTRIR